ELQQPVGKLQEAKVPGIINGRISHPGEEDKYRLAVQPGARLRFDVNANRIGSPLDAVLTLQNESGALLAQADDRTDSVDPLLDFTVPQGTKTLIAAIKDVAQRGGPEYLYRLAVLPADLPDFDLSVSEDRLLVQPGSCGVIRVDAERRGYNGPIRL